MGNDSLGHVVAVRDVSDARHRHLWGTKLISRVEGLVTCRVSAKPHGNCLFLRARHASICMSLLDTPLGGTCPLDMNLKPIWKQLLRRNVKRFRGRLAFKAQRLVCVSLNFRLESDREEEEIGAIDGHHNVHLSLRLLLLLAFQSKNSDYTIDHVYNIILYNRSCVSGRS
jgi:hypothetical protein